MKAIKKVFRIVESELKQSSWFDDGWDIYNRGLYLQLYKSSWYNQNQGGIHFETYIEARQLQKKEFPICMHAEEDCPQQQAFIREFIALEGHRIRQWKGYKVLGDGYNICLRTLPLNFKNLEQRILEELNRLRQLESAIEQTLRKVENNIG